MQSVESRKAIDVVKSCGTCKHCVKFKGETIKKYRFLGFWTCDYCKRNNMLENVAPPYDDPCEKWEEKSSEVSRI